MASAVWLMVLYSEGGRLTPLRSQPPSGICRDMSQWVIAAAAEAGGCPVAASAFCEHPAAMASPPSAGSRNSSRGTALSAVLLEPSDLGSITFICREIQRRFTLGHLCIRIRAAIEQEFQAVDTFCLGCNGRHYRCSCVLRRVDRVDIGAQLNPASNKRRRLPGGCDVQHIGERLRQLRDQVVHRGRIVACQPRTLRCWSERVRIQTSLD